MQSVIRNLVSRRLKNVLTLACWQRCLSSNVVKKDQFILGSAFDVTVPTGRFIDKMWEQSSSFKNRVALVSAETNKSYTYLQLQKFSANFATSLLKKLSLRPGDTVAIALSNCPEYPVVAFGALQAGCIVTTINPAYKENEIIHQLSTKPKVVVTTPSMFETISKALRKAEVNAKIVLVDTACISLPNGAIRYSEIAELSEADYSLLDKIEKLPDDVAVIPFSSGTTGLPKGVEITHRNIMASVTIMSHERICLADTASDDYQEVVPCVLPFFHIYGMMVLMGGHLSKGCKLITMSSFNLSTYLDVIKNERASLLFIVPPIAHLLAKTPTATEEHFRHVKYIYSGAALIVTSDIEKILLKAGAKTKFLQGFAATETTSIGVTQNKEARNTFFDSCGYPLPGIEIKFCHPESGNPVPIGEPGEICIKGPVVMKGYLNNPQATRKSITDDGFYKTGDIGVYKEDCGVFITDRIKELIKVKGMQVAPAELEGILRTHPAVQEVAVVGKPHEFYGEAPKAFIVVNKDTKVTSQEILNYVADKVIDYKRLNEVAFVDSLPKNQTGKILKRELKKM